MDSTAEQVRDHVQREIIAARQEHSQRALTAAYAEGVDAGVKAARDLNAEEVAAAYAEGVRDGMEAAARIVDEEADEWSTVVGGSAQSCQTACDLAAAAIRDSVEDDRG